MKTKNTGLKDNGCYSKFISLKRPSKILWIVFGIHILLFGINVSWMTELSDIMYWLVWIISISFSIYFLYIFSRYYTLTSIKNIAIEPNEGIVLDFFKIQNDNSHNYYTQKWKIKLEIKGNKMMLIERDKYIAKIYKNTLKDKSDWEWLINYF